MKSRLLIITAAVLAIGVAAPQFSVAFAQETTAPKQAEEMMKKDDKPGEDGMKMKDDMSKKDGMKKKDKMAGKDGMKKKGKMVGKYGMKKKGKMAGKYAKKHKWRKGGMGMGAGPGHGMMAKGGGQNMMGMMRQMQKMRKRMMSKNFVVRGKDFSNADIKRMIDGRLAKNGFSRLMAGDVADGEKEQAAVVDVVSAKGEFLFKVRVNRKSGMAVIID